MEFIYKQIHMLLVSIQDQAVEIIKSIMGSGCSYNNLISMLAKCRKCNRNVVTSYFLSHHCCPDTGYMPVDLETGI